MTSIPRLPTEKTDEQKEQRKEMFNSFDPNGNGYLSLAECDKGIEGKGWKIPKPVIMRAFQKAKSIAQEHGSTSEVGESYIERCEFRVFLLYLSKYLELWAVFSAVDTGDDRRIDEKEFEEGISLMKSTWGIQIEDPAAEFKKLDTNDGGQILFDEFAAWGLTLALNSSEYGSE